MMVFFFLFSLIIPTALGITHENYFNYDVGVNDLVDGEWNQILATGYVADVQCADQSEYSFMFKRNSSNQDLIIFFQGGGACFDVVSCGFDSLYKKNLDDLPVVIATDYGFDNSEELKYRSILLVAYCTGDLHGGSLIRDMGSSDDVYHYGYYNARATIDWLFENWDNPERLLISGCSAGGYGALVWVPYIESGMKVGNISHFSDSSVGVGSDVPLPHWGNVISTVNTYYASLVSPDNHISGLYQASALAYPNIQFSQFSHTEDSTQSTFSSFTGGDFESEVADYLQYPTAPNYQYYAFSGSRHCILQELDWSEYVESGILFSDWIGKIAFNEHASNAAPWIIAESSEPVEISEQTSTTNLNNPTEEISDLQTEITENPEQSTSNNVDILSEQEIDQTDSGVRIFFLSILSLISII